MRGTGGMNKRKLDRKNLIYFPSVFLVEDGSEFGRIIDITTGGFMLVRYQPLPEDSQHRVRIAWTMENATETAFECTVTVCWCRKDVNPELFALGCRIEDENEQVSADIARMITRWSFPEW